MNFAVLASGNGSNLQAIIDAKKKGKIKGTLVLVISDKADAKALVRARKVGVKSVLFVDPKGFASREAYDSELVSILRKEKVGLVVLAGFMRILSPVFIKAFRNKVINIHPALLPAFKGAHAVKDALAYGVKATGVTVHFVDEEVDHGAIIAQGAVEIKPKDTVESLSTRIHKIEHVIYPKVIDLFLRGKIKVSGRIVKGK
jgi:phosphoribosylglycinamide formyltransferase-1